MYFDAVLNTDMLPIYNGTPEQTKKWLEENPVEDEHAYQVCIGKTLQLVSVWEYKNMYS